MNEWEIDVKNTVLVIVMFLVGVLIGGGVGLEVGRIRTVCLDTSLLAMTHSIILQHLHSGDIEAARHTSATSSLSAVMTMDRWLSYPFVVGKWRRTAIAGINMVMDYFSTDPELLDWFINVREDDVRVWKRDVFNRLAEEYPTTRRDGGHPENNE